MRISSKLLLAASGCLFFQGAASASSMTSVSGSIDIGRNGSLVYTIPLEVSPGRAGLQPGLALQYDSQVQESGILGVGWKLVGLPEIQPCPLTIAQDARARSVHFDATDGFCLAQKRLIRVAGGGAYTSVEYRIENEEFANVFASTDAKGYPTSFGMRTKDGMTTNFFPLGSNQFSRPLKWGTQQVLRTGLGNNSMQASYSSSPPYNGLNYQDYSPDTINYNVVNGMTPTNSLSFLYNGSSAQFMSTLDGSLIGEGRRLDRISVYAYNGTTSLNWEYRFTYEADPLTALRRLKSIKRCNPNGECMEPTTFSYSGAAMTWSASVSSNVLDWGQDYGRAWVDVSGDGKADYCRVVDSAQGTRAACTLSTGSGFGETWVSDVLDAGVANKSRAWVDVNGDGRADFCRKTANGTQLSCTLMTDHGFGSTFVSSNFATDSTMVPFAWIDADHDGRVDFCQFQNSTALVTCALSTGAGFVPKLPVLTPTSIPAAYADDAEFTGTTGQGLTFLCSRMPNTADDPGIQCFNLDTGIMSPPYAYGVSSSTNYPGSWGTAGTRKWIDVNGDGIADYCYSTPLHSVYNAAGYSCYRIFPTQNYNRGFQSFTRGDPGIAASTKWVDMNSSWNRHFCRVTGSGKPGTMICSDALVGGREFSFTMADAGVDKKGFDWADVTGSGVPSYCRLTGTANLQDSRIQCEVVSGGPGLINVISNGLGQDTTITYTRLTDAATYTKGTTAVYPDKDVIVGPPIVSTVVASDGNGGTVTARYTYTELRENLLGRGKQGFRTVTTKSVDTGVTTVVQYRQDFPYTGMLQSSTTTGPSGAKLKELTNTFDCMDFVSSSGCSVALGGHYFPFVSKTVSSTWDLNGAAVPGMTTTIQLDSLGNPTHVVTSTTDGYSKTVDTTYLNDTTRWLIGRPTRVTVTNSVPQ